MNIRERIDAFWAGQRPDVIPYTIYFWEYSASGCTDDPAWREMFDNGLGVTVYVETSKRTAELDEMARVDEYTENGHKMRRATISTPVGEIYQTYRDDWHDKYWIETAEDYRVMQWLAENTNIEPNYEVWREWEAKADDWMILTPKIRRTPLQTILVDYCGLENFGMHLFEYEAEMMGLYEALLENFRREVDIVAAGPGKYVEILENFSAETLGPQRYEKFLLPVYEECFPLLHQAGKKVGTHYDGKTRACRDLIARAPIDLIESLTPPPEGDQTLAEARAAWPDKLFYSNINVGLYELPPAALKQTILERAAEGAPDGRRLAFEVSEELPRNWRTSMPLILEALEETRR